MADSSQGRFAIINRISSLPHRHQKRYLSKSFHIYCISSFLNRYETMYQDSVVHRYRQEDLIFGESYIVLGVISYHHIVSGNMQC